MAKRTYGVSYTENVPSESVDKTPLDTSVVNNAGKQSSSKKGTSNKVIATVALICSIIIITTVCLVTYKSMDVGFGASTPNAAAIGYVEAIAKEDTFDLQKYMPPQVRYTGYMANSYDVMALKILDENYNISLSNVRAVNDSIKLDINTLINGLENVYNKRVNIKEASKMDVFAELSYEVDGEIHTDDITFNLICIKVGLKWYVYTGDLADVIDDMKSVDVAISTTVPSETSDETSEEETISEVQDSDKQDMVIEYTEPEVVESRPIEEYDDVLSDLQNGHVEIDGKSYVFPTKYQSMTNLYTLVDKAIEEDVRTIKPNFILKNLPIAFVNESYSKTEFYVSIANSTEEDIDVSDGLVTTVMIGSPKSKYDYQVYDYPEVYLPGNITFGSTYDQVKSLYGQLEEVTNDEKEENVVCPYGNISKLYKIELNENKYNCLYFEFVDNELVALQWYFYDLNEFS